MSTPDKGQFDIRVRRGPSRRVQTTTSSCGRRGGRLAPTPDEHLRQGAAVAEVDGGTGQFAHACGRITSNFVLSDTGEVTDHQLGVVFVDAGPPAARAVTRLSVSG